MKFIEKWKNRKQRKLDEALLKATQRNRLWDIMNLLNMGADANYTVVKETEFLGISKKEVCFPLNQAKSKEAVSLLSEMVDIDKKGTNGETTLIGHVRSGNLLLVEALLSHGANPEILDDFGNNALCYAQTPEMKRLLQDFGASEEKRNQIVARRVQQAEAFRKEISNCCANLERT